MSMTPERFAQVRALWEEAIALPAAARAAFLQDAAPDDALLRSQVLALIDAHEDSSELLSTSFPRQLFAGQPPAPDTLVGTRLGAYRVIRVIGQGGMGTVYEAERADDQFVKRVAIKTLRRDRGSSALLEHFARERRIQGALAHPNIATLLDAGVTDDGVPFIVLEFVDGTPIDAYCAANSLSLRARLDLFRQVISAVQHAHRQLIVHRDLKPSNILVTNGGIVKLLDFGISKLLHDDPEHTQTSGRYAFTTAYASPEQIRGEPVSTATDVYSLGVVLFRLLTGAPPFAIEHTTSSVAWTMICEQEPAPPSTAATDSAAREMGLHSAARLRTLLHGELDAIVLMALRKEPERRYATADAFGDDLVHYLRGRPVQARPDSAGYRFRKLVSRNRLATASMVVAFCAMGAGTAAALWQAREARRASLVADAQRQIAERERQSAEGVSAFLQQMFSAADQTWKGQSPGPNTTIAEVIDVAAGRIDTDLADQPRVAESLHAILERIYSSLQQPDKGLAHAYRVLALMEERGAADLERAAALHQLSTMLYLSGKRDSALATARASYEMFTAAGSPETEDSGYALNQLGLVLWDMGAAAEAEPYMLQSIAIRQKVVGNDVVAAISNGNVALIRDAMGDLAGAEHYHRQAEAIYAQLEGREYFEHAYNLNNLAMLLLLKGDVVEAEQTMQRAISVLEGIVGRDHLMVGRMRINLARIELAGGRALQALATFTAARQPLGALSSESGEIASANVHHASILLALGRLTEAERLARDAVRVRERLYPAGDWRTADARGTLGRIRLAQGASTEGRALLSEGHKAMQLALGAAHPRTVELRRVLSAGETAGRNK